MPEGLGALHSPLGSRSQTWKRSCFYFQRGDYSIAWLRALRKAGRGRGRYLVLTHYKSRLKSTSEDDVEKNNFIHQGLVAILCLLTIRFYLGQQNVQESPNVFQCLPCYPSEAGPRSVFSEKLSESYSGISYFLQIEIEAVLINKLAIFLSLQTVVPYNLKLQSTQTYLYLMPQGRAV